MNDLLSQISNNGFSLLQLLAKIHLKCSLTLKKIVKFKLIK